MKPRYVVVLSSENGQWYYLVKAGNHRTLSTSEMYKRRWNCVRAAKKAEPGLRIVK